MPRRLVGGHCTQGGQVAAHQGMSLGGREADRLTRISNFWALAARSVIGKSWCRGHFDGVIAGLVTALSEGGHPNSGSRTGTRRLGPQGILQDVDDL